MPAAILGRKVGMTRYFTEEGVNVPVTVIQAGPCYVTQVKTAERDGYEAVQLAFEDVDPGRTTIPMMVHDAKAGVTPKRFHREFSLNEGEGAPEVGSEVTVAAFEGVMFVDVVGQSKGKGYAGVMKRHNFAGMEASHGVERKHRSPGSIAGHATNRGTGPKPKKGKRMSGHLGDERVTVRNLDVIKILPERNLILVKGPVPGANGGLLLVRQSKRLGRKKQLRASAAS